MIYTADELVERCRATWYARFASCVRRAAWRASWVCGCIPTPAAQAVQHHPGASVPTQMATDDVTVLVRAAVAIMGAIHRLGYRCIKAGAMLMGLCAKANQQGDLFASDMTLPATC